MPDELVDIVNENNELLGIEKMKSEAHADGSWHRCVHVWIYNSRGEVLLQLRASEKLLYPDRWDLSAAGHVAANEEVELSALREVEEEIGIKIDKEDLRFLTITKDHVDFNGMNINEISYVYLCKYDDDISKLSLQKEEVSEIKFIDIDEIKKEYNLHPDSFTPIKENWFMVLDAIEELNSRK